MLSLYEQFSSSGRAAAVSHRGFFVVGYLLRVSCCTCTATQTCTSNITTTIPTWPLQGNWAQVSGLGYSSTRPISPFPDLTGLLLIPSPSHSTYSLRSPTPTLALPRCLNGQWHAWKRFGLPITTMAARTVAKHFMALLQHCATIPTPLARHLHRIGIYWMFHTFPYSLSHHYIIFLYLIIHKN